MTSVTARDVKAAREALSGVLEPTPCLRSFPLEEELGRTLWLKCELFQRTGSFKPRGVIHWLATAKPEELDHGLVTVSAGNHGMALAWAACARGISVRVVMPEGASPFKVEACRRYGAEVILRGDIHAAWAHARSLTVELGARLLPPYDEPRIIAGQGTVALELLEQLPDVDVVLCPVGGGGLISGVGLALREGRRGCRLIGVEPAGAPTLRAAWDAGGPVDLERIDTVAPSLGANRAGDHTYAISREVVDELVTVEERDIVTGQQLLMTRGKLYAEPGGSIGVAALASGVVTAPPEARVAAIVTGGNLETEALARLMATATS